MEEGSGERVSGGTDIDSEISSPRGWGLSVRLFSLSWFISLSFKSSLSWLYINTSSWSPTLWCNNFDEAFNSHWTLYWRVGFDLVIRGRLRLHPLLDQLILNRTGCWSLGRWWWKLLPELLIGLHTVNMISSSTVLFNIKAYRNETSSLFLEVWFTSHLIIKRFL